MPATIGIMAIITSYNLAQFSFDNLCGKCSIMMTVTTGGNILWFHF